MGQALAEGLNAAGFSVVALVDVSVPRDLYGAIFATSLDDVPAGEIDVVVDFSTPDGAVASATWCSANGAGLVIGTTGLDEVQRGLIASAASTTGVIMASNFSIGAVLAERFAAMAAPYFERVEIIELHHEKKVDAPSGTSLTTAKMIGEARAKAGLGPLVDPTARHTVAGARGADTGDGIKIHSVRLPGLVAHQEILFGGPGEGLTIRHDSFDRQSFVQGVALAVRAVSSTTGLTMGIDSFID